MKNVRLTLSFRQDSVSLTFINKKTNGVPGVVPSG